MKIRDFREWEKLNKKYLDTLDLKKYISQTTDVQEIIDLIENDYNESNTLPDYLEGCIFNYIGTEDIAHYLADRYNFTVRETVIYTLYK